jgi:hypothetical protein
VQEPAPLLTAVLAALAGVRHDQAVAVLGPAAVLRVVLTAPDVPGAVARLRPGGRLVAVAADLGAVERTAARHGLVLRHHEPVDGRVAWSASLPT